MKKTIFTFILTIYAISFYGQEFAPVGAVWYYDERFAFSGDINYIKFTSEKDTLIYGELCKKITKRHKLICIDRPDTEYLFTRNDTVFFFDHHFADFQILYDFNATVGDSWIIKIKDEDENIDTLTVTVDSISTTEINGHNLKTLYVTYYKSNGNPYSYTSTIIERIGDIKYMFNWYPWTNMACDYNYTPGLRCYEDSTIGLYSRVTSYSCDYVYSWSGNKTKNLGKIELFPNPVHNIVEIKTGQLSDYSIDLLDLTGKKLKTWFVKGTNFRIDLSDINKGIYVIKLYKNKQVLGYKKLVKE